MIKSFKENIEVEVLPEYLLYPGLLVKLLESLGGDLDKVSESEETVLQ